MQVLATGLPSGVGYDSKGARHAALLMAGLSMRSTAQGLHSSRAAHQRGRVSVQIDIPASANQWPAALASEPRKVSDQLHLGANLVCVMNLKEVTFSKGMSREILPETLSPDYKLAQIRPGCGVARGRLAVILVITYM